MIESAFEVPQKVDWWLGAAFDKKKLQISNDPTMLGVTWLFIKQSRKEELSEDIWSSAPLFQHIEAVEDAHQPWSSTTDRTREAEEVWFFDLHWRQLSWWISRLTVSSLGLRGDFCQRSYPAPVRLRSWEKDHEPLDTEEISDCSCGIVRDNSGYGDFERSVAEFMVAVVFVDSEPVQGALVKGYSNRADMWHVRARRVVLASRSGSPNQHLHRSGFNWCQSSGSTI